MFDELGDALSGGSSLSRRSFLVLLGGSVVVAGCSGSDDSAAGETSVAGTRGGSLARFFDDPSQVVGDQRRLVFGLVNEDGSFRREGPDRIAAVLAREDLTVVAELEGIRRGVGLPRAYYEFRVPLLAAGVHYLQATIDGAKVEAAFTAAEPGSLPFQGPGDVLEPFDTPTVNDGRGVDPICTREPHCPFHDVSLSEALGAGRPVAYLVGTPAYCQTAICGPVLDVMISLADEFPEVAFIHAEVYTDDTIETVAPAVAASGLTFEPVVFIAGSDGVITERLDVIFDEGELREHLGNLA